MPNKVKTQFSANFRKSPYLHTDTGNNISCSCTKDKSALFITAGRADRAERRRCGKIKTDRMSRLRWKTGEEGSWGGEVRLWCKNWKGRRKKAKMGDRELQNKSGVCVGVKGWRNESWTARSWKQPRTTTWVTSLLPKLPLWSTKSLRFSRNFPASIVLWNKHHNVVQHVW